MLKQRSCSPSPPLTYQTPKVTFTNQINYKERANILFNKLNSFKTNLQNQKQQKFSQVLEQIRSIQNNLSLTTQQKQEHFQEIINTLSDIDKQIHHQKTQFDRFSKILQNIMESTNRQCQNVFDKMNKQSQNNQLSIQKYIDFKIESFFLKNKGTWLEQDLLNFQPFKEELNYLKKQVQQFYKNQSKQTEKIKKQISDTLDKQKQFLLVQMKRTDHQDIMAAIQQIYTDIRKKVTAMTQKRQKVEHNVLSMIQNVINSYVRDTNKFK